MRKIDLMTMLKELKFSYMVLFLASFVRAEDETLEMIVERFWNTYVLDESELLWYNKKSGMVTSYAENGSVQVDYKEFFDWFREYHEKNKIVHDDAPIVSLLP